MFDDNSPLLSLDGDVTQSGTYSHFHSSFPHTAEVERSLQRCSGQSLYDFMLGTSSDCWSGTTPMFLDALSGTYWTRRDVQERADALAVGLHTVFNICPQLTPPKQYSSSCGSYLIGPVISLISPNDIDFGTVIWAAHKLGCTVAPSNAGATAEELIHQLRLSGATFVIAHPASLSRALTAAAACGIPPQRVILLSRQSASESETSGHRLSCRTIEQIICLGRDASARGASVDPQHDDDASPRAAFLCFSSGTNQHSAGLPKAVVVPHRALIADILLTAATSIPATRHYVPGSDSVLGVIPMSHMYGLLTLVHLYPYLGIMSTLYETLPPFEEFLDSVERLHIEHLLVVPPLINAFLKHPKGAGRMYPFFKSCLVAAAPLDEEREKQFRALGGPDFHLSQVFGMTETAGLITGASFDSAVAGSVGRLLPCVTAKIVDGDGRIVPIGSPGELLVKGPQVCLGYLDNPAATGEAFDNEGFLRTGDLVILNEHGDIFVKERLKQIIKCKGFQVSPAELEGHILGHPFVQDVGVIGRPDERAGEVPVAFITLSAAGRQAAATSVSRVEEGVKLLVREHKSTYKWLGDVFIVEEIPKLPSGKILVRELKKLLDQPDTRSPPPADETLRISGDSAHSLVTMTGSSITAADSRCDSIMDAKRELAKSAAEKRAEPAPRWHERAREWLSLYRVLYALALSFNIAGAVAVVAHRWRGGEEHAATFALSNIILAVLWRNEVFVRAIYIVLLSLFKRWPPLGLRDALSAFMLHIGGLHSGFATAGFLWLVAATVELHRQGPRIIHVAILVMSVVTCALVFLVMLSAYPAVRTSHHNTFENVHRFVGWTGIAAVWAVVTTSQTWNASTQRFEGHRLWMHADVYLTFFLTFLIILPWTTLRKVAVDGNVVSGSVVILRFRGGMRPGLFGRVARTPLSDYHAFGIVSHGPRTNEHYMCVVGQGDFTRRLAADPPTHLWTRSFNFAGLPYLTSLYRSGLYVVTGSAIGVALPVFLQASHRRGWHLLWISANIEATYHDTVLPDLRNAYAPDDADGASYTRNVTVWDTRVQGRPNTVQLIHRIVQTHDLEVVFVTSNPKGTAEILRGCRKLSIPVHGPIWDS